MNAQDTIHPLAISNAQPMSFPAVPTSPPLDDPSMFISPTIDHAAFDDFEDLDYQSGLLSYQKQHSNRHFSMAMPIQMKPSNHQPAQDSFGYDSVFPMSAPAEYHFGSDPLSLPSNCSPVTQTSPSLLMHTHMDSPNSTAKSFDEDEYSMQVNMQVIMDKRRRRRESHNAGKTEPIK
ncbi:hypothetical protein DM01DRAFT_302404 [Hesseltinella vesiculosa]|uniref:Uncharacterized protein n=1 Tax=Hesseltinella vesiculosa TaxID=101127 RepID=A0A1X2G2G8_9FUNG|nr:hypothetical protein DM01DRAFT_302404 [Hesseltinella vesiculosa]